MAYQKALVALGSPTRCLILERLRDGPASVGEIAAGKHGDRGGFHYSHLPILRDKNDSEREQKRRHRVLGMP